MAIRLNRYISEAGFCSRREADGYIMTGSVTVNGELGELNSKVSAGDVVSIEGERLMPRRAINFTQGAAPKKRSKPSTSRATVKKDVKPDFITRPSRTERVAAGSKGAKPKTGKSDELKASKPERPEKIAKAKPSLNGKKYTPKKMFNL